MNRRVELALLELLRAGLWEQRQEWKECPRLDEKGWNDVYRISCQQTVGALVCRGLHFLPKECEPPFEVAAKWAVWTDSVERRNRRMNEALQTLLATLEQNGLHPVLQKGQGIARFYANPLTRECGDIDLYFPNGEWKEADERMRKEGLMVAIRPDESSCYQWKKFVVEHHAHLFDLQRPALQPKLQAWETAYGFQEVAVGKGVQVRVPHPVLDVLLQDAHILKHAMGHGIGLRQLCDLARTLKVCSQLPGWDRREVTAVLQEAGLEKWSRMLMAYLERYLALPEGMVYDHLQRVSVDFLADVVRRGGNFGQYASPKGVARSTWQRKCDTVAAFVRNARFSLSYVPAEALCMWKQLMIGQFKR